jgi:anti-sigma factor RsiW
VNDEAEHLSRYLDGDLSPREAELFRARLAESPELARQLQQLQRVGALLRLWADGAGRGADHLLEPTLRRIQDVDRRRARHGSLGLALAAVLALALPWSSAARHDPSLSGFSQALPERAAAIERLETGGKQARVFVLGKGSTPVVWLADEVESEDQATAEQDPG